MQDGLRLLFEQMCFHRRLEWGNTLCESDSLREIIPDSWGLFSQKDVSVGLCFERRDSKQSGNGIRS